MHAPRSHPLRIVHVLRAPIGGLFRHVYDLAEGQAQRGHAVGIIADSLTGGTQADAAFAALAPRLQLGVMRLPIARHIGPGDMVGLLRMFRHIRSLGADVLHGHGAKGGACARLAPAATATVRAYTPHGGSLHYRRGTPLGLVYGTLERLLMPRTDLLLFESAYARDVYAAGIGTPDGLIRVVHNGVRESEFVPVAPRPDATDLVFIGELRHLKGIDVLLEAAAALRRTGRRVSVTVVGEGPDGVALRAHAERLGLADCVRFVGFLPARDGFARGRILVVPSRNESLPYIVLEAAAAGVPILASKVGGIPEIFGSLASRLLPPGDSRALAAAIAQAMDGPDELRSATEAARERVREHFSLDAMVGGVLEGYREAMTARIPASR